MQEMTGIIAPSTLEDLDNLAVFLFGWMFVCFFYSLLIFIYLYIIFCGEGFSLQGFHAL